MLSQPARVRPRVAIRMGGMFVLLPCLRRSRRDARKLAAGSFFLITQGLLSGYGSDIYTGWRWVILQPFEGSSGGGLPWRPGDEPGRHNFRASFKRRHPNQGRQEPASPQCPHLWSTPIQLSTFKPDACLQAPGCGPRASGRPRCVFSCSGASNLMLRCGAAWHARAERPRDG